MPIVHVKGQRIYLLLFSFGGWGQVISCHASRNAESLGTEPPVCQCPHTASSTAVALSHQQLIILQPGQIQPLCCTWASRMLLAAVKCLPLLFKELNKLNPVQITWVSHWRLKATPQAHRTPRKWVKLFLEANLRHKANPTGEPGEYHPSHTLPQADAELQSSG